MIYLISKKTALISNRLKAVMSKWFHPHTLNNVAICRSQKEMCQDQEWSWSLYLCDKIKEKTKNFSISKYI